MTNDTAREIMSYRWILLNRCRDDEDIDDIMQDAVLKLLQKDSKLANLIGNERKRFIIRCIVNSYVDLVRRRLSVKRGGNKLSLPKNVEQFNNIIDPKSHNQPDVYAKLELQDVMKRAEEHQFFPVLKLYVDGYTIKEIAEMTGTKVNTVLGRHRYLRQFLKNDKKYVRKKIVRHPEPCHPEPVEGHGSNQILLATIFRTSTNHHSQPGQRQHHRHRP